MNTVAMQSLNVASLLTKTAALDLKKLPQGTEYPTPYELRWKTPGGNVLQHTVKPELVEHGNQVGGDAYYQQLVDAMNSANREADARAPKDIAADLGAQRLGGGMLGATLGGLAGLAVGAYGNAPGVGAGIGALGGGLLGYKLTKGTPKSHMEYEVGEDLGDHIPGLYAYTPPDDQLDDIHQMRREMEEMNQRQAWRDFMNDWDDVRR